VTDGIDLSGKTAIVTGSSSGIGLECARVLALRGARVIMANRNENKTAEVISRFSQSIGADAAQRCEFRGCDTSRLRTVDELANGIAAAGEKIDLVFLNAGVFGRPFQITEDGLEATYATNYVGHFLLVHSLATGGLFSADARIIATQTSGIQNPFSKADQDMLRDPNASRYKRSMSSPNSKVLLALMMTEFTRRREGTPFAQVTFNAGDPGATLTDNINQVGPLLRFVSRLFRPVLLKPVEEGAAVLLWIAASPELAGQSGRLFSHKLNPMRLPRKCVDPDVAGEVWGTTESVLGLGAWNNTA
jgi:NAD(P)-dependent dehydrogenase (short-subunit alcohol dehydrogenase family)